MSRPLTWTGVIWRNVQRRPSRALFTLLGVALAVAGYVALTGLTEGLVEGAQASHDERGVDLVVTDRNAADVFAGSLREELGPRVAEAQGVAVSAPELSSAVQVNGSIEALATGWAPESFPFEEMRLESGRRPEPGQGEVVVGTGLARSARLSVGDQIDINGRDFRVSGVSAYEAGFLRNTAIMPLDALQSLLARPGQVTLFQVRLRDPGDEAGIDAARAELARLAPGLSVSTTAEALRASRLVRMIQSTSLAISLVALAIGTLSVLNTMAMAVEERTREIGVLAAIGWSRRRIIALVLCEGFVLALLGGLLGVGLGWAGQSLLTGSLIEGAETSVRTMADQALRAFVAALVIGLLGSLAPAWKAARLRAAEALRR